MSNGLSELVEKEGRPDSTFEAAHPPVIGVARPTAKVGILGVHKANGAAVAGFSESGEGVRAESEGSNGILGVGALNGVVGETKANVHSGVLGLHKGGGRGVSGLSEAPGGIGVWGSGAHLAGKFEGNVEVTGTLSVGGEDILQRLSVLQQQLEKLIERLDLAFGSPHGKGRDPIDYNPQIEVRKRPNDVQVIGRNFKHNRKVTLHVIDTQAVRQTFQFTTSNFGRFGELLSFASLPRGVVFFAATDETLDKFTWPGKVWTNTVTLTL